MVLRLRHTSSSSKTQINDITYDKNPKRKKKNPQRTISTGILKSHGSNSVNLVQDYTFLIFTVEIGYIWNTKREHQLFCFDGYFGIIPNDFP